MYTEQNFKSKAALKKALKEGQKIRVFQPGLGQTPTDGKVFLEGPHYPQPHTWYAEGILEGGFLVKVK